MGSVVLMKGMWQSWWTRLSVIAGFGLLVRLAFVLGITRFDEPVGDQLYYSAQALTNARGGWFEQPFLEYILFCFLLRSNIKYRINI